MRTMGQKVVGKVMQQTGGKADPGAVREILTRALEGMLADLPYVVAVCAAAVAAGSRLPRQAQQLAQQTARFTPIWRG